MRHEVFCLIVVLVTVNVPCESFRALGLFPVPIRSHFNYVQIILKELARRGNEVHVLSHFPEKHQTDGYKDISIAGSVPIFSNVSIDVTANKYIFEYPHSLYYDFGSKLCEDIINHTQIHALKDTLVKYDLILMEVYGTDCLSAFASLFDIPIVGISPTGYLPWVLDRMGNPDNPSYIPNYFTPFTGKLHLLEKMQTTFANLMTKLGYHLLSTIPSEMRVREVLGNNIKPLDEIAYNTSLMLVNAHFSLNEAKPTVPGLIEIAGLHIKNPKPLPTILKDRIKSNGGVIYVSFGTVLNITTMAEEKLKALINSLGKLNETVFISNELERFTNEIPKNFVLMEWFPQLDVLCDLNTLLFITHGGPLSIQEAAYCGVPIIGVPIYAEHELLIENYVTKGAGIKLYYKNLTENALDHLLNELITNNTYKLNAKKLSLIFKDRPMKPLDASLYWIEYVYRFGGAKQLRSRALDIIWFDYFLIDIGLIIGLLGLFAIIAMLIVLNFLQNYFDTPWSTSIDKNKKEKDM